ncbi:MAG: hypothetical protein ACAI35_11575 [Candidatus Methylacidiphilales bacterium]|nr:hypothetical protein [Candidatus Methylacidiphilales bacterium]
MSSNENLSPTSPGDYSKTVADKQELPLPPDIPWWLVLLLTIGTLGLFTSAWLLVILNWTRKLDNKSAPLLIFIAALPLGWGATLLRMVRKYLLAQGAISEDVYRGIGSVVGLMLFFYFFMWLASVFTTRDVLVKHYNKVEPMGLELNGFLTFFCPTIYFQYHLSRIAAWKKTGHPEASRGVI